MKAVFSIFAVIFMQLSVATLADTKPYIWNNGTKTDLDKIADAKTLLSAEKYETYRALLKEKDCDSAAIVLNKAFIEKYPEMSFAQEAESYTYLEWKRLFSDAKYLELSFCFDVNEFEALEEKRKSSKALIGKFYAWEPPITYNKDWEARDWSIRHIISLADDGHLPALVYVGQMARQGDIFDKSKEIEFFIFARACAMNFRCSENLARLEELEKHYSKSKSFKLKRAATDNELKLRDFINGHLPIDD